jgi:hypothetical protein
VQRRLAVMAVSLAAVAVAGGAVWAGVAPSSGKATPAPAATDTRPLAGVPASSTDAAAASSSDIVAVTSSAGAAPSSPIAVVTAASSAAAVSACQPENLGVTNPWGMDSGMGGGTVEIVFKNRGSKPCSLTGWPTVSTPGVRTKVQYETTTGAGFTVPVSHVVLTPGRSADAALDIFGVPNSTYSQACFGAGSWAVTLPGSHQPSTVAWPKYQGACPGGTVEVSPFYVPDPQSVSGFSSADPATISQLGPFDSPPTVP